MQQLHFYSQVMNMSSLMDRLPFTYLLIFSCSTFVCMYGRAHDLIPSCKVGLMVQRGRTRKAAPHRPLTVSCPVKHCGESINVTWCKLPDGNECEQIHNTENVEIKQNDKHVKDELISFLTFKRISIHDDGLYRCNVKGHKYEEISHIINVSVSDLNHGVKNSTKSLQTNVDEIPSSAGEEDVSWLPYFTICVAIALLVATLTVLTLLNWHGWKQTLTYNCTKGQEISTHVIPDLPKRSSPVLQTHFSILNSPNTAERPPSQPPLMTSGKQPVVANTAVESQDSDCSLYAVINHPARGQHVANKQNNTQYAAISVS